MLRRGVIFFVIVVLLFFVAYSYGIDWPVIHEEKGNLIRFHVIANSDTVEDQAMKRAIRDRLISDLENSLRQADNIEEARKIIIAKKKEILQEARFEVENWGKNYDVKLAYGDFLFPTKNYGNFILPAGKYEALRVIIGEGKGQNWWCVLFPPLCFVDITTSLVKEEVRTVIKEPSKPSVKKVEVRLKLLEVFKSGKAKKQKIKL